MRINPKGVLHDVADWVAEGPEYRSTYNEAVSQAKQKALPIPAFEEWKQAQPY